MVFLHEKDAACDLWLLICGCATACVSEEGLEGREILRLSQRKDFVKAGERIRELLEEEARMQDAGKETASSVVRELKTGDSAWLEKTFTEEDIRIFADLSLDRNPMHLDPAFSKKHVFRKPVVHGVLVAALLSSVMGSELPGPGTVLMEESVHFLQPVYPGEKLRAEITFTGYEEKRKYYIGTFEGKCINPEGIVVVEGTFCQMMQKKYFKVTGEEENDKS